jgi:MFS family permease
MDSIGRRAVVVVGGFFVIAWVAYLFMNSTNFWYLIPLASFIVGLLAPAYWEGITQFMVTLSHPDHRTAYAGWFWTWFGLTAAVGPVIGGAVYDLLEATPMVVGQVSFRPLHVLIVAAILLTSTAQLTLARMRSPQRPTDSVRSLLSTLLSAETLQTITGNMLFWRRPPKD